MIGQRMADLPVGSASLDLRVASWLLGEDKPDVCQDASGVGRGQKVELREGSHADAGERGDGQCLLDGATCGSRCVAFAGDGLSCAGDPPRVQHKDHAIGGRQKSVRCGQRSRKGLVGVRASTRTQMGRPERSQHLRQYRSISVTTSGFCGPLGFGPFFPGTGGPERGRACFGLNLRVPDVITDLGGLLVVLDRLPGLPRSARQPPSQQPSLPRSPVSPTMARACW